MHSEEEAAPGKSISRSALRERARKKIGDTGILGHLPKHMIDKVVTNGKRFRRRHNEKGKMEYWFEDASFKEIRRTAGIEDPSWIPPPRWKPGDTLPGRGELYGYCDMTTAEDTEMKCLKETVDKVKSGILESLSALVKRATRGREVTHEREEDTRSQEGERSMLEERTVHGELSLKDQGDQNATQQQKSISDSQEGRSTRKSLTHVKSQLEADLSEVRKSVALMPALVEECVHRILQREDTKQLTSKEGHGGRVAIESSRTISTCQLSAMDAKLAPSGTAMIDLSGKKNCFANTFSTADENLRISIEGNDRSCFVRPGMVIPQTGAFGARATEDVLSTGTPLPPTASTSCCLVHDAETCPEDASARVIDSITGPDNDPLCLSLAPPSSSMQLSFREIVNDKCSSWLSLGIGTP